MSIKCGKLILNVLIFIFLFMFQCQADGENKKCDIPTNAPKRLEEVMGICEEEIKYAILAEALKLFNIKNDEITKQKRSVLTQNEKRVAGCLLQCVYQKMKVVDDKGYPVAKGLIEIYTEGVKQKEYIEANVQAVNKCLTKSLAEESNICITAYNTFNCISDEVAKYCGQTP